MTLTTMNHFSRPQEDNYQMDTKSKEDVLKAEKLKTKGEFAKAEKKITRVLKKYPDFVGGLHLKAVTQMRQEKMQAAYATLQELMKYNPQDKQALQNRALAAFYSEDEAKIEEAFPPALEALPDIAELQSMYGLYLHRTGRVMEALNFYKKAIELDPTMQKSRNAILNMAHVLYWHKEYDTALNMWLEYLRQYPDDYHIMCRIADALQFLGRTEEAVNMGLQALAHNPDHTECQKAFILTLRNIDLKDFKEDIYRALFYCLSVGRMDMMYVFPQWYMLLLSAPDFKACRDIFENKAHVSEEHLQDAEVKAALQHDFLRMGLKHMIQASDMQEKFLVNLRKTLLGLHLKKPLADEWLPLAVALAECAFINEFVWNIEDEEQDMVESLYRKVEAMDEKTAQSHGADIVMMAAYEPLKDFKNRNVLLQTLRASAKAPLEDLAVLQIAEPLEELDLRDTIETISDFDDDVSQKVREQYEEYPYPRWRSGFKPEISEALRLEKPKEVLVAGCGTGRHITVVANERPNSRITALDLSLSSLAYAKRKIKELDIPHVKFLHGDILDVEGIGARFDHIECSGVLHHMDNPLEGWRKLTSILKPGGTMRIGLYSELARRHIVEMRGIVQKEGFANDLDGIRKARMHVFAAPEDSPLKQLLRSRDFYSTASCRDLIMHVQEHRYTIDRLKSELHELGLEFEGFCPISAPLLGKIYRKQHPNDPAFKNLQQIKAFEQAYPNTFRAMYSFDVRKPEGTA